MQEGRKEELRQCQPLRLKWEDVWIWAYSALLSQQAPGASGGTRRMTLVDTSLGFRETVHFRRASSSRPSVFRPLTWEVLEEREALPSAHHQLAINPSLLHLELSSNIAPLRLWRRVK